jgi:hypothetical protein
MAAMMGTEKTTGDLTCVACGVRLPLPADPALLKQYFSWCRYTALWTGTHSI